MSSPETSQEVAVPPSSAEPGTAALKWINRTMAFYRLQIFLQVDKTQRDQKKITNLLLLSSDGKGRMEHMPNILGFQGFGGVCPRDCFLSHLTRSAHTKLSYFGCLGDPKNKAEFDSLRPHYRACNTIHKHKREQETIRSGKTTRYGSLQCVFHFKFVFFSSVTSVRYFLIFSISLLRFSMCSSIRPSLVTIFTTHCFKLLIK